MISVIRAHVGVVRQKRAMVLVVKASRWATLHPESSLGNIARAFSVGSHKPTAHPAAPVPPTNPSVVEEWVEKREAAKRESARSKPPVPVAPGEHLIYVGGTTTKKKWV